MTEVLNKTESLEMLDNPDNYIERSTSITSSLRSIYDQYAIHFDAIKCTGFIVLLALVTTMLSITSNIKEEEITGNSSDCIQIGIRPPSELNNTLCTMADQYPIPNEYFATVCKYQGDIRIDLRHFINGKPTIRGIYLSVRQWNYLQVLATRINRSVKKMRVYKKSN